MLLLVIGAPQDCASADGKLNFTVSIRAHVQIANNEAPTSSNKLAQKGSRAELRQTREFGLANASNWSVALENALRRRPACEKRRLKPSYPPRCDPNESHNSPLARGRRSSRVRRRSAARGQAFERQGPPRPVRHVLDTSLL
jgi:hypothetical protein